MNNPPAEPANVASEEEGGSKQSTGQGSNTDIAQSNIADDLPHSHSEGSFSHGTGSSLGSLILVHPQPRVNYAGLVYITAGVFVVLLIAGGITYSVYRATRSTVTTTSTTIITTPGPTPPDKCYELEPPKNIADPVAVGIFCSACLKSVPSFPPPPPPDDFCREECCYQYFDRNTQNAIVCHGNCAKAFTLPTTQTPAPPGGP